jgi:hypothetical protein
MVTILSALAAVSLTCFWADLDQAEAFQPGRAFIARTQQHQRQQQRSLSTTLWATQQQANATSTAAAAAPETTDWIADDFSVLSADSSRYRYRNRLASQTNVVVGPSQILVYDTSLRGTLLTCCMLKCECFFVPSYKVLTIFIITHYSLLILSLQHSFLRRRHTGRIRFGLGRRQVENLSSIGRL